MFNFIWYCSIASLAYMWFVDFLPFNTVWGPLPVYFFLIGHVEEQLIWIWNGRNLLKLPLTNTETANLAEVKKTTTGNCGVQNNESKVWCFREGNTWLTQTC